MKAVELALGWVGTPYRHQASLRGVGCDCLGLVHGIWRELGHGRVAVPGYAAGWGEVPGSAGEPLLEAASAHLVRRDGSEPQPGDVIVFRMLARGAAKHCGIAVPRDRFVHAYDGAGVVSSALTEPWRRRIAGVFAFPTSESEVIR